MLFILFRSIVPEGSLSEAGSEVTGNVPTHRFRHPANASQHLKKVEGNFRIYLQKKGHSVPNVTKWGPLG